MNLRFLKKENVPYKFKTLDPKTYRVTFSYLDMTGARLRKVYQECINKTRSILGKEKAEEDLSMIVIPEKFLNVLNHVVKDPMVSIKEGLIPKGLTLTDFKIKSASLQKEGLGYRITIIIEGGYHHGTNTITTNT